MSFTIIRILSVNRPLKLPSCWKFLDKIYYGILNVKVIIKKGKMKHPLSTNSIGML